MFVADEKLLYNRIQNTIKISGKSFENVRKFKIHENESNKSK